VVVFHQKVLERRLPVKLNSWVYWATLRLSIPMYVPGLSAVEMPYVNWKPNELLSVVYQESRFTMPMKRFPRQC